MSSIQTIQCVFGSRACYSCYHTWLIGAGSGRNGTYLRRCSCLFMCSCCAFAGLRLERGYHSPSHQQSLPSSLYEGTNHVRTLFWDVFYTVLESDVRTERVNATLHGVWYRFLALGLRVEEIFVRDEYLLVSLYTKSVSRQLHLTRNGVRRCANYFTVNLHFTSNCFVRCKILGSSSKKWKVRVPKYTMGGFNGIGGFGWKCAPKGDFCRSNSSILQEWRTRKYQITVELWYVSILGAGLSKFYN